MGRLGPRTVHFFFEDGSGKVGIGTATPSAKLTVADTLRNALTIKTQINSLSNGLAFQNAGANYSWNIFREDAGSTDADLVISGGNSNSDINDLDERLRITSTSNVGISLIPSTNLLEVAGTASKSTAGDWLANSDARLKTTIRPLDSEAILQKMLSHQGITYEWADDKTGSKRPAGTMYDFTAQNIRKVFPTLLTEDKLGFLQTAYGTYDAMYVEAMRAQQRQIEELKAEIKALKSKNESLQSNNSQMKMDIEALKAAVFGTTKK